MTVNTSVRIEKEKRIIALMIRLYCVKSEGNSVLCPDCEALLRYAHARLDHCPFGAKKGACKRCAVHCYKPDMRERMRCVMRFVGPRMILYAPLEVFRHWFGR
ncbi:MAG: nitrous oxide-stimulated promoter family protein [Tannerellaceae bacterium]